MKSIQDFINENISNPELKNLAITIEDSINEYVAYMSDPKELDDLFNAIFMGLDSASELSYQSYEENGDKISKEISDRLTKLIKKHKLEA